MALANYTDLQASVIAFLHRADLAAIVPDLITLGELRINGDLDARSQDSKVTLSTVASTETVALPSDCINIRHISISSSTPARVLEYLTPDSYENLYPFGDTGTPAVYTVIGSNLYLAPIPSSIYTLDFVYKGRVPSIAAAGTTWLMTNYPNVYLYATLCEAAPYMKDDGRIRVWDEKYNEAIAAVNHQDWFVGGSMRVRTDVRP